ncbi:unnamed protein product [Pleuronectes platessa]|uniref:Protein kinase domain-containing protein n=1 Tax=Pleuronectes platessa TaxID=8262 RepID=A0A9N7VAU7_PLEPL|nr:unnamed protein product [Pleuronectes platessa]
MSQNSDFNINEGDLIPSPTTYYLAQKYLGNGGFDQPGSTPSAEVDPPHSAAASCILDNTSVYLRQLCLLSPEILYEEPFSGAIDVWSLGCIADELSMGPPLFRANDEDDLMRQIAFAIRDPQHEGNLLPHAFWPRYWMEGRFMGNHPLCVEDAQAEYCDLQCFIDLMTQMLMTSQYERITPDRILQHPFITMSHLQGSYKNSLYVKSCEDLMDICQDQSSEDGGHGDQVILQMSLNEDSSSSTAKEGSKVNAKSGKRPEDSQAKVRRSERLAAARRDTSGTTGPNRPKDSQATVRRSKRLAANRKGASGQMGPNQCKRMRDRHDPTSNGNPSTKKTNMGPAGMRDEKPAKMNAKRGNRPKDSQATVRRRELLAATRKGASGQTGPIWLKRMREREDSVGQNRFMGRSQSQRKLNGRVFLPP